MRTRQLSLLFVCSLVGAIFANGLMPLLPVYAARLGADAGVTGYYLAFCFLTLAVGAITAGWLSDKFQHRKLMLILVPIGIMPAVWMMGRTTQLWHLVTLTATVWLLGGMGLVLLSILASLSVDKEARGKVFGILSLTNGLGALIGGGITGLLVDHWGYATLFTVLTLIYIPRTVAAFFLEDKVVAPAPAMQTRTAKTSMRLGRDFYLLFWASLAAAVVSYMGMLIRSLAMDHQGFSAAAISSTVAVAGVITLPVTPKIGSLSDRLGRKPFLVLSNLAAAAGMLLMMASASLWQFWVAVSLLFVAGSIAASVGSALVTDLVSPSKLGRGMSLFNTTNYVGGIVGFGMTGYAVQTLGMSATLLVGAGLSLVAIALLLPLRHPGGVATAPVPE
jgi:MFS family permease